MSSRRMRTAGRHIAGALCAAAIAMTLGGCVNQHPEEASSETQTETVHTEVVESASDSTEKNTDVADADFSVESILADITEEERAAVTAAKEKVEALSETPGIVATSPAVAIICDKLELDLVGVCSSTVATIPQRYEDVTVIGTAMSPDMEIVASVAPDWILSPSSLQSDLQSKYENINTDWAFLNLKSVAGMYRSIQELGEIFDRTSQADALLEEYQTFYAEYQNKNAGKEKPKVLILMGLPGSYIIATENSYVGSLVEMAGGENVYAGTDQEFLIVNTEDMKTKEPDIILRAAHALPDEVTEMFDEDFKTNDIWKHFHAVSEGRVYDLSYDYFGMSANFDYPQALEELQPLLYPQLTDE